MSTRSSFAAGSAALVFALSAAGCSGSSALDAGPDPVAASASAALYRNCVAAQSALAQSALAQAVQPSAAAGSHSAQPRAGTVAPTIGPSPRAAGPTSTPLPSASGTAICAPLSPGAPSRR